MDAPKPPLLFANRVFRTLVDHQVGEDVIMLPQDYRVLRIVFRWCQGSWEQVYSGNIVHMRLLAAIVTAWGALPERQRFIETV